MWTFKFIFNKALCLHWSHCLQSCWNSFMPSLFVNIHISICGDPVSTLITLLTIMLELLHAWSLCEHSLYYLMWLFVHIAYNHLCIVYMWTFKLLFKEALCLHCLQSCWNFFMSSLFVNIYNLRRLFPHIDHRRSQVSLRFSSPEEFVCLLTSRITVIISHTFWIIS